MIDENDLKKVISQTIGEKKPKLDESYVAQPKTYPLATELLSQKTKEAHLQMYQAHVSKLNEISAKLDTVAREEANCDNSEYRSLKQDEVFNMNAVYLHELYFANCFDPHSEIFMDTNAYMRLERDFGTFHEWQTDFFACACANREGWAITGYNVFLRRFVNVFVDGNDQGMMVGLVPIISIDVWSHAYARDYLADRKSYVLAMMKELNWDVIEERVKKVQKIEEALR